MTAVADLFTADCGCLPEIHAADIPHWLHMDALDWANEEWLRASIRELNYLLLTATKALAVESAARLRRLEYAMRSAGLTRIPEELMDRARSEVRVGRVEPEPKESPIRPLAVGGRIDELEKALAERDRTIGQLRLLASLPLPCRERCPLHRERERVLHVADKSTPTTERRPE